MRPQRSVPLSLALLLVLAFAGAELASAAGFGLFQHGGRAIGQAGALTARAHEPSAVFYNPAAISQLPGLQVQAGLDFSNTTDKYQSSSGSFSAKHIIDFPPALYLTWKAEESPLALGIGIDAPFWYRLDWLPALFPGRFLKREMELRVFEVHPVVAWDLGEGWSFGGGLRYLYGDLAQGENFLTTVPVQTTPGGPLAPFPVEVERYTEAQVDAFAWDAAVHYTDPVWGWGAVFRSNAELKGSGKASYDPRPSDRNVDELFPNGRASQAFEIPRELRGGFWFAPYPELRIELDGVWQSWSSLENTSVTYSPDVLRGNPQSVTELTPRDWDDTIGLRLGLEGNITDPLLLYGGVAFEPSPVPNDTVEPGFPRGDAWVYALGVSYSLEDISFDLGYSFHDHGRRGGPDQEPANPTADGSYVGSAQVWGFSVRRRW